MNAQTVSMAYLIASSNVSVRSFSSEPIVQCCNRSVLQAKSYQVLINLILFFRLSSTDTCMKPLECIKSALDFLQYEVSAELHIHYFTTS